MPIVVAFFLFHREPAIDNMIHLGHHNLKFWEAIIVASHRPVLIREVGVSAKAKIAIPLKNKKRGIYLIECVCF